MKLISNKPGSTVSFHSVVSNTIIITGNSTVSNVAFANSTYEETIVGAALTRIIGSTAEAGSWTIARGANVIIVGTHYFQYDLQAWDFETIDDQAATLVLTLVGTGSIFLELSKNATSVITPGSQP